MSPSQLTAMNEGTEGLLCRVPLPLHAMLDRLHLDAGGQNAQDALRQVTVQPQVLQEFRPLTESLEWELSELHWAAAGVLPFVENDVPFLINNSGRLSENVAALLFANCLEVEPGERIVLLELGAGTGLFARYVLDAFRAICAQEARDFYDRVLYLVSDRSPRTVEQWEQRGLFADHAGHVILGTCDALAPSKFRPLHGEAIEPHDLRAVFCNYVLDVLPSTVIRNGPDGCEELCVRTHLSDDRGVLGQYTTLSLEAARALATSDDPTQRAQLIPLLSLFELEAAFRPIGQPPPHLEEALQFGTGLERVLLSHGAIDCLEACVALLHSQGFIVMNDYGPVRREQIVEQAAPQRFGATSALGVNFPLIEHHFARRGCTVVTPEDDAERSLHARLFLHTGLPRTVEAFRNRFSGDASRHFEAPLEEARQHVAAGRKNDALASYRTALGRSPRDWQVVGEAAEFVALQLRDFAAGLELARAAVAINPWYSSWLWNVLGDCLFCLDRFDDAHEAYVQAQRIDPGDPRTNLNLAYTYLRRGAYTEALEATARGLGRDVRAAYRERLLEKQQQILGALSGRWLGEQERLAQRATRLR